jgi:hypothetical protein
MPQANADAEIRALQALIEALEPLDDEARSRVLEYTLKRLGMRDLSTASSVAKPLPEVPTKTAESTTDTPITDIRSLRETKKPSSGIEMTAIVAYYLAELAPSGERKSAITTADVEKYFKQANYRLPTRLEKTLNNAAAAGYFDRAARGAYRLNPVGFNLVTQTLPRGASDEPRRTQARRKSTATTPKASAKKRKK